LVCFDINSVIFRSVFDRAKKIVDEKDEIFIEYILIEKVYKIKNKIVIILFLRRLPHE